MSKLLTALLAAVCCLCMTACASSNQDTYEYAESALGIGEYDAAIALFEQLGEYRDAAVYRLYAEALEALAEGELDLARANFELIAPFKSSDLYLACIEAVELDRAGEMENQYSSSRVAPRTPPSVMSAIAWMLYIPKAWKAEAKKAIRQLDGFSLIIFVIGNGNRPGVFLPIRELLRYPERTYRTDHRSAFPVPNGDG